MAQANGKLPTRSICRHVSPNTATSARRSVNTRRLCCLKWDIPNWTSKHSERPESVERRAILPDCPLPDKSAARPTTVRRSFTVDFNEEEAQFQGIFDVHGQLLTRRHRYPSEMIQELG